MIKLNLLRPKFKGHYVFYTLTNTSGEIKSGWLFNNCKTMVYDKRELNGFNEYEFHTARFAYDGPYGYLTNITVVE